MFYILKTFTKLLYKKKVRRKFFIIGGNITLFAKVLCLSLSFSRREVIERNIMWLYITTVYMFIVFMIYLRRLSFIHYQNKIGEQNIFAIALCPSVHYSLDKNRMASHFMAPLAILPNSFKSHFIPKKMFSPNLRSSFSLMISLTALGD